MGVCSCVPVCLRLGAYVRYMLYIIWNCATVVFLCAIVTDPNCSFPFTYDGGLFYNCIKNMTDITTIEEPLACVNVNATKVICDSPSWS